MLKNEIDKIKHQRDEIFNALEDLVIGLERTHWSSWQVTAHFSEQQENARIFIDHYKERKRKEQERL